MKAGTCRHFTGIMNEACAVGVRYRDVRDETVRPYGFPCLAKGGACAKFDAFTRAEADTQEAEFRKRIGQVGVARAAIIKTGLARGAVECHVCGGELVFAVHSNGHVHAHCSTDDCLRWME